MPSPLGKVAERKRGRKRMILQPQNHIACRDPSPVKNQGFLPASPEGRPFYFSIFLRSHSIIFAPVTL